MFRVFELQHQESIAVGVDIPLAPPQDIWGESTLEENPCARKLHRRHIFFGCWVHASHLNYQGDVTVSKEVRSLRDATDVLEGSQLKGGGCDVST